MVTTYPLNQFADVRAQLITAVVLLFLATALVCLRFLSRAMRHSKFGLDDYFCLLALVAVYGIVAIAFAWAVLGMGVHVKYLPMANLIIILKMLIPFQFLYGVAIASVKCSYLFFYLRIFPYPKLQRMSYICMAIVLAWWVGNVLQIFLMCEPFAKNWDNSLPGRCGNRPIGFTIIGALEMATDVIIILLPLPWVRRLQMPSRAKLGLYLMFGIGLFITAVSIVRMHVLSKLNFADISYAMKGSCAWTFIETSVAVINSCIPMLRPLFARFIQSSPENSGADKSGGGTSGATGSYHLRTVGGSEHHVRAPSGDKNNFVRLSSEVGDHVAVVEDKSVESWRRRDVDVESGIDVVVERHCITAGTDDKGRRESVVLGDECSQRTILHAL